MLEHVVELIVEFLIPILELMGIIIVAFSAIRAFWFYGKSLLTHTPCDVKLPLAQGLVLSLEFKMAAEILKTVIIRDLQELLILGAVIVIRALLSHLIHIEMKHY